MGLAQALLARDADGTGGSTSTPIMSFLPIAPRGIHLQKRGIMPCLIAMKEAPMPKLQIEAETAHLEARVPVQVYDQMQRALDLLSTAYICGQRGV